MATVNSWSGGGGVTVNSFGVASAYVSAKAYLSPLIGIPDIYIIVYLDGVGESDKLTSSNTFPMSVKGYFSFTPGATYTCHAIAYYASDDTQVENNGDSREEDGDWTFTAPLVPTVPTDPAPDDADTGVDFSDYTLSWVAGENTDTYDVYIGPSDSMTLVSSAQIGISYTTSLEELESVFGASPIDQIIYWKVDATNDLCTITGDEWSFDARVGSGASGAGPGGAVGTPSPEDAVTDQRISLTALSWEVA